MTSVLVVGANGRVGREVIRSLAARGVRARAAVRRGLAADLAPLADAVVADLTDSASLALALQGCGAAFFVTPHHANEERLGRAFIEAAEAAGVRRLVFASSIHPDSERRWIFRAIVAALGLLTHYGPKLRVEYRVRTSPLSPVVLMPTNFFQNDELFENDILSGTYPQPLGTRGINRVDCRDIGDAAARALTDESVASGAYPLVGLEPALTGPQCAQLWSGALGRPVAYDGSIERWRLRVATLMHEREREDFGKTYRLMQLASVRATPQQMERLTQLLGRPPRSYVNYVAERAARLLAHRGQ